MGMGSGIVDANTSNAPTPQHQPLQQQHSFYGQQQQQPHDPMALGGGQFGQVNPRQQQHQQPIGAGNDWSQQQQQQPSSWSDYPLAISNGLQPPMSGGGVVGASPPTAAVAPGPVQLQQQQQQPHGTNAAVNDSRNPSAVSPNENSMGARGTAIERQTKTSFGAVGSSGSISSPPATESLEKPEHDTRGGTRNVGNMVGSGSPFSYSLGGGQQFVGVDKSGASVPTVDGVAAGLLPAFGSLSLLGGIQVRRLFPDGERWSL